MYVDVSEIRICLDKARELDEHYKRYMLNHEGFPRPTEDFLWIFGEYLGTKIKTNLLEISSKTSSIKGIFISGASGPEVYLLGELNFCWRRFVLCKELFHAAIDDDRYRNMDLYAHVSEVTLTFPERDSKPGPAAVSEYMAEIAAAEFLFPYRERATFPASPSTPLDYKAIAENYKIPQVYVEKYLSDGWMRYLGAFE